MELPFLRGKTKSERQGRAIALPNQEDGDPLFLEQFKALRAKFEYKADLLKLKVVAMTSAIAGEGKTISCANLAINLALSGRKKVLVIDVDLHKSDLARGLDISLSPGLGEFLSGSAPVESIVRNSVVRGMHVIPGGAKITAPADLLAGERFRTFLSAIRSRFDIILLDTPPILPVSDTLCLRDQVDGFIFVFRAGFTPYTMLKQAVEEIGEKNVIGVVLNGIEPHNQKYYQRYYGKYYKKSGQELPAP